ncbi:metalloprotease PmbA [Buchnera aphidicola (Periphyllus koelreuteriae)]|uniref:metalloprotease PmbA n=1 Tax=Buchnera aphidicola TaxID=9 RepID=UPI0031B88D55
MNEIKNFLEQEKKIKKIILKSINKIKNIIDEAFIRIIKTYNTGIVVRNGKTEYIEFHDDAEFFISVYSNYKQGTSLSKDLSSDSIKKTIFSAINISKYTSKDKCSGLPEFDLLKYKIKDLNLFHPINLKLKDSIKLAYLTEKFALNYNSKIINSEGGYFNSSNSIVSFGNTKGIFGSYKFSNHSLSTCVLAKNSNSKKIERDYYYSNSRKLSTLKSPKIIGINCAKRVLLKLNSRKIITQKCPVILISDVAYSIFNSFSKSINGNLVYKKSTFLLNDLNKLIFPKWMNIFENPHIKKGIGSCPFDDEGTLTAPRFIIKNGFLKTWLLNSYTSKKLGLNNTGHSGGIYNWIFLNKNNNFSFKKLLKFMNTGLVITDLMGDGVNMINGNYSRGASGYFIKNNFFKYSVSEITISGNLKNIFKNIVLMSNDYNLNQNIQCGSILISEMNISGK